MILFCLSLIPRPGPLQMFGQEGHYLDLRFYPLFTTGIYMDLFWAPLMPGGRSFCQRFRQTCEQQNLSGNISTLQKKTSAAWTASSSVNIQLHRACPLLENILKSTDTLDAHSQHTFTQKANWSSATDFQSRRAYLLSTPNSATIHKAMARFTPHPRLKCLAGVYSKKEKKIENIFGSVCLFIFIHLKGRGTKMENENSWTWIPIGSLRKCPHKSQGWARLRTENQTPSKEFHDSDRDPNDLSQNLRPPRLTSRKLHRRWSSQDLNWHSNKGHNLACYATMLSQTTSCKINIMKVRSWWQIMLQWTFDNPVLSLKCWWGIFMTHTGICAHWQAALYQLLVFLYISQTSTPSSLWQSFKDVF